MIDVEEFLARGIIAARTGKIEEARHNLNMACRIEPSSTRIWLWLAAVSESPTEQRLCLEKTLAINPSDWAAKVLLERLDRLEQSPGAFAQAYSFACPRCGGTQRFDPDRVGLTCTYCGETEPLAVLNAAEDEQSLEAALERPSAGNWALAANRLTCEQCGAMMLLPADQAVIACPFCTSPKVLSQPAGPGLLTPNAIVPFSIEISDAQRHLRQWLSHKFRIADDLAQWHSRALQAIYLPFWTFDGQVQVCCQPSKILPASESAVLVPVPVHSLPIYKFEPTIFSKSTRIVRYDNEPIRSREYFYEQDVDDLLIYAGRSVPLPILQRVLPFDLKAVVKYRPEFLVGWQAEAYQIALVDAALEAHKRMRDQGLQGAEQRHLIRNRADLLADDCRVTQLTYKLVLLPVWIMAYRHHGKSYRILINGQTGKVDGEKPVDWIKLMLVLISVMVIVSLLMLFALLAKTAPR